jgi:hypothetical protein
MKTMKGLAGEIGVPYSTAKLKKPEVAGKTVAWGTSEVIYEVWYEEIRNFR